MIEKEAKSSDDLKKLASVKQDRNFYTNRQAGDKVKTEKIDQASQSVDHEMIFEDWRFNEIIRERHLKELRKLLSSYPVLKTIKPKLTGSLRGPISAPKPTPNVCKRRSSV